MSKIKDEIISKIETGKSQLDFPKTTMPKMPWGENPDSLFSEGEHSKFLGRRKLPTDEE